MLYRIGRIKIIDSGAIQAKFLRFTAYCSQAATMSGRFQVCLTNPKRFNVADEARRIYPPRLPDSTKMRKVIQAMFRLCYFYGKNFMFRRDKGAISASEIKIKIN